ncbi:MAG: hypothetical protein AABM67_19340 [Acidobacteriota bacterium]
MKIRTLAGWLVVLGLGIGGTVQYHLAQFSSRFNIFFGDRGDARGFAYYCEHWYQSFLGKANLLSPGVFYPTKATLAYSDLLVGFAVPYSCLRAAGIGMFSSIEIVVVIFTFLSYVTCLALLYKVLRFRLLPSCAGAMFFAFNSPKFFQTGHLQLQFIWLLPLIFAFVISFAQKAGTISQKRAVVFLSLAGVLLNLQLATAFYYAWFFLLWSFFFLILAVVFRRSRLFLFAVAKKYWRALAISAGVFLLVFLPFLLVYIPTVRVGTWYSYSNVSLMIPEWWSLLSMGEGNYLWGWLSAVVKPNPPPATWGELMVGIGLISSAAWIAITVYAVFVVRKHSPATNSANYQVEVAGADPKTGRFFLALMILTTTIFYLFGIKFWGEHSPWYFVYGLFPGAGAIRAMARYVIFLSLPISIAFAFTLHSGMRWISRQESSFRKTALSVGIILVAGFGVFEQFGVFKVGGTGFPKRPEQTYLKAMSAKLPVDCKAFYIAPGSRGKHNPFEYQYDAMLISILSGIPTLNGSSSQFPPNWDLYLVKAPDYEDDVRKWIELHHLDSKICRLEIGPQIEDFYPHSPNPIYDPRFFVSQQYRDFLDREPSGEESEVLAERIKSCQPGDKSCTPQAISMGLFNSTGFFEKGAFVFRLYEVGLGRMPRFEEFKSSMRELGVNQDPAQGEKAKENFVLQLAQNSEFANRYQGMTDSEFIDTLLKGAQVSSLTGLRKTLAGQDTRAQILSKVTQSGEVSTKLKTRAFVALQYFVYLKRDPEGDGFDRWLDELNKTGDFLHVASGFVNSSEYRERFGYAGP